MSGEVGGSGQSDAAPERIVAVYESPLCYKRIPLVQMIMLPALGLAADLGCLAAGEYRSATFCTFWLCIAALLEYQYGCRVATRLELTATSLRWRSAFRGGEVPLSTVRAILPSARRGGLSKLLIGGSRPVHLLGGGELELELFVEIMTFVSPAIEVRVSRMSVLGLR